MVSKIQIATSSKKQLIDITNHVEKLLEKSKIEEGLICIFAQHTTCSIIISEIEDSLEYDIIDFLEKEGPKGPFKHSSYGNTSHTSAHILSSTIGQSVLVPFAQKALQLGTWQRICLLELDGPRKREIVVKISS